MDSPECSQSSVASAPTPSTAKEVELLREKLAALNEKLNSGVHHVYYSSRTHSQLSQVINELRRNNFLMFRHGENCEHCIDSSHLASITQKELCMTIIASKSRYCINEDVRNHPELSVEEICGHEKQLTAKRQESVEDDGSSFKRD